MKQGVLLMAYGSPNSLDEVEGYYTDIRRGRKPTPELLEELTDRYRAIGGSSPLLRITQAQAASLEQALGNGTKVYVGMRHWNPWIREAVEQMAKDGVEKAVGIVMAPHYSSMSIAKYIEEVEKARQQYNATFPITYIESWHEHPLLLEALTERIQEAQSRFHPTVKDDIHYIFTAHSLPKRILEANDPYEHQLLETSRLLADKIGTERWAFAYQSAGRTEEEWLGPDLIETIDRLYTIGCENILVCSVGFITDHLEVLYDIDVEAKQHAESLGIRLERAPSLNDHPKLAQLFAELVNEKIHAL